MMRILHVVPALRVGGLERVVLSLLQGYRDANIECGLACILMPGAWYDDAPAAVKFVGDKAVGQQFLHLPTVRRLRKFIRTEAFTVVHSHNALAHRYTVAASLGLGTLLVHTKHGRGYPDNPRAVWLNRQYARCTKCIIAVSEDAATVATTIEKIPQDKVMKIVNGVDMERFRPPTESEIDARRNELRLPADAFVFGWVGRLDPLKNLPMLLNAFAAVYTRHPQARLLVVGDGPDKEMLKRHTETVGLANGCCWLGAQDDVTGALHAMDAFCLSSHTEGTSISLIEAAACGLPAVVTDVGGNTEVVRPNETGFAVRANDEAGFADAMIKLVDEPETCRTFGHAARAHVAQYYSHQTTVRAHLELYNQLLTTDGNR